MADMDGHAPPAPAEARHVPTLALEHVMLRFHAAGVGRSRRSLIRYCQTGLLDGAKGDTANGATWFVTEASVDRAIQQIKDMIALTEAARPSAPQPDAARHNGAAAAANFRRAEPRHGPPLADADDDVSLEGQSPPRSAAARFVAQLEKRIEEKDQVIGLLTTQLSAKDQQITDLSTRYRETHSLLGAMQRMLAPLLGQADPYKPQPEARASESA